MRAGDLWPLVRETLRSWREDKAMRLAGALAFYATLSIPPILLIALVITSQVLGSEFSEQQLQRQIVAQFQRLIGTQGAEAADALATIIEDAERPGGGVIATLAGLITLGFGATGAFVQMQDALNTIWEVAPAPDRGLSGLVKDRLFSLTLVVSIGFVMLVSLLVSAALAILDEYLQGMFPGSALLMRALNFLLSLAIIVLLFATLFKVVPDVEIEWSDVWFGAAVTALLFTVGKWAIGLYLGNSAVASTYGAAGSLVVLLLWVYYSSNIFFLGAEFTYVYANAYGSRIVPAEEAVPLTEEMRVQQGIPHQETTMERANLASEMPIARRPPAGEVAPKRSESGSAPGEQNGELDTPAEGYDVLRFLPLALLALVIGLWRWRHNVR